MEAISKAASAASRAIRGENRAHGEEPVSGKMGNVAAGEPYDAGNMDPKDAAGASTPSHQEGAATEARTTGTTVPEPMTKPEPEAATKPRFVDQRPTTTTTTTTTTTEDPAGPAKSAPSAHGVRGDSTKAQSDTRPPDASASSTAAAGDEPSSQSRRSTGDATMVSPETLERDNDDNNNNNNNNNDDDDENREEEGPGRAVNLQGPGPRPLEQVAREHGGDAGAVAASEPAGGHQRRDSGKGLGAEGEGAARGKGEDEYVRSSGFAADGGDFDASRPGAGREADRE
ncbi:uncharacterized protein P884DRAFT_233698 [Thermothelomyces heterothallicus CBS 202.75]|uniref:uncharacterized protein n=1 Tax=Thermothelomyces heterothallicus CBS 202.75 TaxID=1149848 RepID=UPI0037424C9D